MKRVVDRVLGENQVCELVNDIKNALGTQWVYIYLNVFRSLEKSTMFKGYTRLRIMRKDGTIINLVKVALEMGENNLIHIAVESSHLNASYYAVRAIEGADEKVMATLDPEDAIFILN